MSFFERQAAARRTSSRLMWLFVLAVLAMVGAVVGTLWLVLQPPLEMLVITALGMLVFIALASLFRIASLRDGGEAVARQLGGTEVPPDTTDPDLRRLRNVVEEVAIASGVPMPQLFVLEHEAGINAFAAGYAPADAAVAVTRGALDRLNRDELQGVVAHEFSHVLNGDMRLNIRLVGVLFGILAISTIGRKILHAGSLGGRSSNRDSGAAVVMVVALVAVVVGAIGLLFGRLIKAGISRSREMLADASAVQFTRQPQGLAGALKKIAGLEEGSRLRERADAEEISHMLFGDGVGLSGMFSTHPPILARIQALEPGFKPEQVEGLRQRWRTSPPSGLAEDRLMGLDATVGAALPAATSQVSVSPPVVSAQVATPAVDDYKRAGRIRTELSESLRALARDRNQVMPLLFALLLDVQAQVRQRQLQAITEHLDAATAQTTLALATGELDGLHPMLRLPLAELAFPALRLRPRPQLNAFLTCIEAMGHADDEISLFEYCLSKLLQVQVIEALNPHRHARFGRRSLRGAEQPVADLLAVLAQTGHPDDAQGTRHSWIAGMQRVYPNSDRRFVPVIDRIRALDNAWPQLDALDALSKQVLVEAMTATTSHDGRITVAESELLRTICAVLHCPLPPMLEH